MCSKLSEAHVFLTSSVTKKAFLHLFLKGSSKVDVTAGMEGNVLKKINSTSVSGIQCSH